VFSGRGFCYELITRPEESYRLLCVVEGDLETSSMRRPWPTGGCYAKRKNETLHGMIIPNLSYRNWLRGSKLDLSGPG